VSRRFSHVAGLHHRHEDMHVLQLDPLADPIAYLHGTPPGSSWQAYDFYMREYMRGAQTLASFEYFNASALDRAYESARKGVQLDPDLTQAQAALAYS